MQRNRYLALFGSAAVLGLSSLAFADAAPSQADMASELKALRAEVSQMKASQGETWLDQRRTDEVKQLVREVLNDADTRASLEGDGMTAGYGGNRFFLASQDGTFRLNIGGQVQLRYVINHRNDAGDSGTGTRTTADDNETGFQLRRVKLWFDGYIGDPKITYKIKINSDRNNDVLGVEVVTVGYKFTDQLSVSAGQFKDSFMRESMVDDARQTAVERSTVEQVFTNNYVQGIQATWTPAEVLKLTAAFHDGAHSGDIITGAVPAGAGNDFQNDTTNYAATVRADFKVMGDWKQAEDYASWSSDKSALFIGAAATYQESETGDRQSSTPYDDGLKYTVDASFKSGGFNVAAAFVGQEARVNAQSGTGAGANANHTRENMGAVIQAGYFVIPDKFEPFVRYEWLNIDSDAGSPGAVSIFTFGANYYLRKHDAKFSVDVMWAPQSLTSASTFGNVSSGIGALADSPVNEDQVVIRAQFQLMF